MITHIVAGNNDDAKRLRAIHFNDNSPVRFTDAIVQHPHALREGLVDQPVLISGAINFHGAVAQQRRRVLLSNMEQRF